MNLKDHLASGRPFLFDGAMGTLYGRRHPGSNSDMASLENPQAVAAIHKEYIDAGAMAIKTNTFGLSGLLERQEYELAMELLEPAVTLALQAAANTPVLVFADIGPAYDKENGQAASIYIRQIQAFLELGIDHFIFETLYDLNGIDKACRYIKDHNPDAFVLVSFAPGSDGVTKSGIPVRELLKQAEALSTTDAIGLNCMSGPYHMYNLVRNLPAFSKPLSIMPNAGYPEVMERNTIYRGSAGYFASQMERILSRGVPIAGGCCGTTPEHIQKLAHILNQTEMNTAKSGLSQTKEPLLKCSSPLLPLMEKKKIIAVELDPPANDQIAPFMEGIRRLSLKGADVITIADCPIGRPRADACLLACKVKRELGVEVLPHMTCRDRNLNAAKALLLGLSIEDIHQILLVTGDPIPSDSRDEVKSVFSFNSRKLAWYIKNLCQEQTVSPFLMFGALNINAPNFDVQLRLAKEKEANGIQGFLTQPVLSQRGLDNLIRARKELKGKILGGIFPVVSWRNALFLKNEISGMDVSDEILSLYKDKDRSEAEAVALKVSTVIAKEIEPYVDGFYLMTPFQRISLMERILTAIQN